MSDEISKEQVMNQQVDTEKIILKTRQYEFADGLREIQNGVMFILMGLQWSLIFQPEWWRFLFMLEENYGEWAEPIAFSVLFVPVVVFLGMLPAIKYIRRRWLWRESGMVTSFLIFVPIRYLVISSVVFIGAILLGLWMQPVLQTGEFYIWSMYWAAAGWGTAVSMSGLAKNYGISRYKYLSIFAWLVSPLILLYQSSIEGIGLVFMLGWGMFFLISGMVALKQVWPAIQGETYV